jgi:hypothetical protein
MFKVSGFKGKCSATKAEFILICTTGNKKICLAFIGSKINHFICIFWRMPVEQALTVEQMSLPPKPLLLRLPT